MNVLLIHQFFLRDGEAGGSRFNDMVETWTEAGHQVTVLAGDVHYQTGERTERDETTTANVIRVSASAHGHRSRSRRIRSYATFAVNASKMLRRIARPDIVVASSPSLPVVVPAMAAKAKWDIPFVFEVRDLWPESAITTGVLPASSWVAKASYALEELAYEIADHVVALTPAIAADIESRGLAPASKLTVISNGVAIDAIDRGDRDALRSELGWGDKFVVLYAGAHGIANHLWTLLEAAEAAKNDRSLHFVTLGDGPLRPALMKQAQHLDNVQFLDAVPKESIYRYLHAADVGAAVLQQNRTFRTVYPNKIFDYMAVGRPVLCAIEGAACALVQTYDAGICVRPEDGIALLDGARTLRDQNRSYEHSIETVRRHFDRGDLARQYENLLSDLIDG